MGCCHEIHTSLESWDNYRRVSRVDRQSMARRVSSHPPLRLCEELPLRHCHDYSNFAQTDCIRYRIP